MAYMDQDKKAKIAAALKLVMPAGWKYTLAVHNHSEIICTIRSAPVDLLRRIAGLGDWFDPATATHLQVNTYHVPAHFSAPVAGILRAVVDALNTDNHDRSDFLTDYVDVGHYVALNIGLWNKPFVCTSKEI